MRKRLFLLGIVMCIILLAACKSTVIDTGPKREVSEFSRKVFELKEPLDLNVDIDSSNIEIYSWDKAKIKFEIKKRIRGTGEEKDLKDKLKNFSIDIKQNGNMINYKARYNKKIKNAADIGSDLRIFIPKRAKALKCVLDIGAIKVLDDIKGELYLETNMVNVEIKRIKGKLNLKGNMGNCKVENGELSGDSSVVLNFGNIDIKAKYKEGINCSFETHTGNIDLQLPEDAKVCFENLGTVEMNEFTSDEFPTKIKNSTGMGRITLKKYK